MLGVVHASHASHICLAGSHIVYTLDFSKSNIADDLTIKY